LRLRVWAENWADFKSAYDQERCKKLIFDMGLLPPDLPKAIERMKNKGAGKEPRAVAATAGADMSKLPAIAAAVTGYKRRLERMEAHKDAEANEADEDAPAEDGRPPKRHARRVIFSHSSFEDGDKIGQLAELQSREKEAAAAALKAEKAAARGSGGGRGGRGAEVVAAAGRGRGAAGRGSGGPGTQVGMFARAKPGPKPRPSADPTDPGDSPSAPQTQIQAPASAPQSQVTPWVNIYPHGENIYSGASQAFSVPAMSQPLQFTPLAPGGFYFGAPASQPSLQPIQMAMPFQPQTPAEAQMWEMLTPECRRMLLSQQQQSLASACSWR
jgi:hypothetical protein